MKNVSLEATFCVFLQWMPSSEKSKFANYESFEVAVEVLNIITLFDIFRSYRQRVQATNKEDIFKTEGGHTFFIPVDEGFKVRIFPSWN